MKGFAIIAYDDIDSDFIDLNRFSRYLDDEKISYEKREFESDHHNVIVGFQFFEDKNFNKEISKNNNNIFVNGKIYGDLEDLNDRRSDDQTTKEYIHQNDQLDSTFLSFEGSCVYAIVKNNAIYLQNDFEGYKRIFYYKTDGIFCVSTSLPLITKIINQAWKVRKNAIFSHLLQRECKWPLTFIEGIMVLPPLTRGVYKNKSFTFSSRTFADAYQNKSVTRDDIKREVYQDYKNIILRESFGKVAVTLSGGYDSNCLVKLYKDNFKAPFTAVSLGYASNRKKDSNVYDETIYAQKIADNLGIDFKRYLITEQQFLITLINLLDL
ncbi:asparagine synthase-related protein [Sphingobacterium sp. KU25419]|nr:asparagine synthase-related protein [Sphingobacterium sp. KU25419]